MAEKPALRISRRRLWLFRIFAPAAILLGVCGLEVGLRLCGYGYPTSFFLKINIQGKDYYVPNDRFGYRFFPPALARTPLPMRMAVKKPANTYRIFVFGESAAMGDPDPTFGAWRYLQVLLRERFPKTDFEVVCVAMTAINSHVILPIARECARRDGDLWIIYMGNNEMVGPFGGGTVFGSRVAGIHLIRASLAVKSTKSGQLLDSLVRRWAHSATPQTWRGLDMFKEHQLRYDDPNRLRAYENFKQNLDDILRAGRAAGVPVILSTVGSNLKDCAPFGSLHSAGLDDTHQSEWDRLYREGITLEGSGDFPAALKKYERAAAIDPQYAELHFRSGRCQLALTNFAQALSDFELARDDDTLAFRADTRINRIIQDAAQARANQGVDFLDARELLAQGSRAKIPGNELFYEHVHLNFDGNYLLGRAFAEQSLKLLPKSLLAQGKSQWASAELCDRRLAVSPWDRFRVWQENYSRVSEPPFTGQLNDVPRAKFYIAKLQELNLQMTEQARAESRAAYEEALALRPGDYCLRENFAQFLDQTGSLAEAPGQEQQVSDLLPQNPMTPCIVGRLLVRLGNDRAAEKSFLRALAIRTDYVPALNEMGMLLANQQQTSEAAKYFARSLKMDPGSVEAYQNWGFMEQNEGSWNEAINHYQAAAAHQPNGPADYFYHAVSLVAEQHGNQALDYFSAAVRMDPNFWQARYLFGGELASEGRIEEAQAQFAEAVRTRPDFAPGHLNDGLALAKAGKLDEAVKEFQITLELNPTNLAARQNLEAILALKAGRH
ncbi:MAG TPA: tetratricopeptide repeat protein [Verrucomicrobiae bacterium]|nr:tetratricopeptide repeat protein [Verrucomicrobiae bacterium]